MEMLTFQMLAGLSLLVVMGIAIGFAVGSRRCFRRVRRLERDLNRQHLETLDRSSQLLSIERQDERCERLDRLVKLTLGRLKRADAQVAEHERALAVQQNLHRVEVSRLTVQLVQSRERCQAATALARRAAAQLQSLEPQPPISQTLSASAPMSYGQAEPVLVNAVDQEVAGTGIEPVSRVSNRDSAVLTRLHSSNDESSLRADNLQAIEGIDTQTELSLNAAGIHRVEQLAELTDAQLARLRESVGVVNGHDRSGDWIGGARELIQERMPAS